MMSIAISARVKGCQTPAHKHLSASVLTGSGGRCLISLEHHKANLKDEKGDYLKQ